MRRLFNGNTTVLYEGKPVGTPDPGAFWRRHLAARREGLVYCADGVSSHQARRPERRLHRKYDLSGFRTLFLAGERCDPDTLLVGGKAARCAGDRSLVANRNRLADRRKLRWAGDASREAGIVHKAGPRLRCPRAWTKMAKSCRPGQIGSLVIKLSFAARLSADVVEQRRGLPEVIPQRFSRLLPDRRCWLQG